MRAWAVGKILLVFALILGLLVMIFDGMTWADRCEQMGGVVYQASMFSAQQCVPNLNLEPKP
jgi:hypothetical protein